MRSFIVSCAFLATAVPAMAQMPPPMRGPRALELRPTVGVVMPTGDQRDVMDDAATFGMQVAWELKPALHLLGSFGWSPTHHSLAVVDPGADVFQYDVGAEFNLIRSLGESWELKPFLGLGVGARTYRYDADELGTNTCQAGYATLGTELQRGVAALRLEARNVLYCYEDPVADENLTRNDLALSIGVAYHVRRHR